jgi:hypothetical protein
MKHCARPGGVYRPSLNAIPAPIVVCFRGQIAARAEMKGVTLPAVDRVDVAAAQALPGQTFAPRVVADCGTITLYTQWRQNRAHFGYGR